MNKSWQEIKASMIASSINMMNAAQAVFTPAQYDKLAEEGFNKNIWVYRCVMAVAQAVSTIPLVVYQKNGAELIEIENHPLLTLMQKPNPDESATDFKEKWVAFLLISGNTYLEMNGPSKKGPPTELWAWRPDRVTVIPDNEGIKALRYTVNGIEKDLEYDRAIHIKYFHATDDYYGLSPLEVGRRTFDMDNATTDWNTSLVQNHAAPSGFLTAERQVSEPEYNRLKRAMRRMFGGIKNAGKAHLLEGGLKWQQMGLSPKDVDFINSRKMSREELCAIYGVPPQIVGIQDHSTYANYAEARQAFYMDTVLPLLDKLLSSINHKVAPLFGENIFVGYDKGQIEALQESAEKKWSRVSSVKEFLLVNEIRRELGYGDIEGGDVRYVPDSYVAVGDDAALHGEAADLSDGDEDDPVEETIKFLQSIELKVKAANDDDEFIERFNAKRDEYIKSAEVLVKKRFKAESKAILDKYDGKESTIDAVMKVQEKEWIKMLTAMWQATTEVFARDSYSDILNQAKSGGMLETKFDDHEFEELEVYMHRYIDKYVADEVKLVTKFTKEKIKHVIGDSVAHGETLQQAANRIRNMYEHEFSLERALTIARTEILSAASYANQQGALATGLPMLKKWIAGKDDRTRPTHRSAHGQTVDIDKPYIIGDEEAMFPGDPSLTAKERIRCRCAERYIVQLD